MNIFFSGGGSPWTGEIQLANSCVMLSYYTDVYQSGTGKAGSRLRKIMKVRRRARKKENHGKGK